MVIARSTARQDALVIPCVAERALAACADRSLDETLNLDGLIDGAGRQCVLDYLFVADGGHHFDPFACSIPNAVRWYLPFTCFGSTRPHSRARAV